MQDKTRRTKQASLVLAAALALTMWVPTGMSDTESVNLPNGTAMTVAIDSPADGAGFTIPSGMTSVSVPVEGTATIGEAEPDATVILVVDVSGSTVFEEGAGGNCGGDVDNDGLTNTILDCEVAGALAVRGQLVGAADQVGYVVFANHGAAANMIPGGGSASLTDPEADLDGANGNDADQVINSSYTCTGSDFSAGVMKFTPRDVDCDGTDYSEALRALTPVVGASSNSFNLVLYLSDGNANDDSAGFAAQLASLAATGAQVETFAVGPNSSCDPDGVNPMGELHDISDATGGDCEQITQPDQLLTELPQEVGATLESLWLSVNGGAATQIPNSEVDPDLPLDGPASASYATSTDLPAGDHLVCVKAVGSDPGGSGSVEDCHKVHVNSPPDCSKAVPSIDTIWPPNHKFVAVAVLGTSDPDGDATTLTVTAIAQDEPTTAPNPAMSPDGTGVGTSTAELRAERMGDPKSPGDGRVYHVAFSVSDDEGATCSGKVAVAVPHDMAKPVVDGGALYDSTV